MPRVYRKPSLWNPRDDGALCDQCPIENPDPVQFELPSHPRLILLGESPGDVEHAVRKPFQGPTGQWVESCIEKYGLERTDIAWCNSTACQMPEKFDWLARKKMVECCRPAVSQVLQPVICDTIMACGQGAMWSTIEKHQVEKNVGMVCEGVGEFQGFTVLTNYHPTYAGLRQRCLRSHWVEYLRRALETASGCPPAWSWGEIHIGVSDEVENALEGILTRNGEVAVDVETAGKDPVKSRLMCLGVYDIAADVAVSIPWDNYSSVKYGPLTGFSGYGVQGRRCGELMRRILETSPCLVTQNGQHDTISLRQRKLRVTNGFDTLRANNTVYPQSQGHRGLEQLGVFLLPGCPRWKTEFRGGTDEKGAAAYVERDQKDLMLYNAKDCVVTGRLKAPLSRLLDETHRGWELYHHHMELDEIAAAARTSGVMIDLSKLQTHKKHLNRKMADKVYAMRKIAARFDVFSFNPESAPQRKLLFFTKLKVKSRKYSEKTGQPSLDEGALRELLTHTNPLVRRLAQHMWDYRAYAQQEKIRRSIAKNVDALGILRPEVNVDGTISDRWTYTSPNVHTIPKPRVDIQPDGSKRVTAPGLRDMFIARPGCYIVEADSDRLELYIIGVLSQDKAIIAMMKDRSSDAHSENAKALFGSVDKARRNLAKTLVYNINYGNPDLEKLAMGAYGQLIIQFPNLTYLTVLGYVRKWFEVHSEIADWRDAQSKKIRKLGYQEVPISEIRRHFYGKPDDKEGFNLPIQGFGSVLINRTLKAVHPQLRPGEKLLIQAHDALILEGPDPLRLCRLLRTEMERPITYEGEDYSFPCSWKIGLDWGNAIECVTEEEVEKAKVWLDYRCDALWDLLVG